MLDHIGLFDLAIFDRITAEGEAAERELAHIRERENAISAAMLERRYE